MSWECDRCHEVATGRAGGVMHFAWSRGRCETCEQTTDCCDCRCEGRWDIARRVARELAAALRAEEG